MEQPHQPIVDDKYGESFFTRPEDIESLGVSNLNNTSDSDSSRTFTDEKKEEVYLDGMMMFKSEKTIFAMTEDYISYTKVSTSKKEATNHIPFADIVGIETHPKMKNCFVIYCFVKKKPTDKKHERRVLPFVCRDEQQTQNWINTIRCALRGIPVGEKLSPIRLIVLVNPAGGSKKSAEIWKTVKTMFEIANIECDVLETKKIGHASEIAQKMDISKYNGVVCISGDGLLYEVLNGLLTRDDWKQAIKKIPLGIIPGGSGNGFAAFLGVLDPLEAAFAIIKGKTASTDVLSVLHGKERNYILLSLTWALIADIDKESEKYRWMGGFRFTFTAIGKIISSGTTYKGRIKYLPADSTLTKERCGPNCNSCKKKTKETKIKVSESKETLVIKEKTAFDEESDSVEKKKVGPALKVLNHMSKYEHLFRTIEVDLSMLVVANVGNLSYDTLIAPYAHLCDGFVDIVYAQKLGKSDLLKILLGLEQGKHLEVDGVSYVKARALILEPLEKKGYIMLDGEHIDVGIVKLEVHRGLAKVFKL